MKKWKGRFRINNPMVENDGHQIVFTVEAETEASARNKLIEQYSMYDSNMVLIKVEEA